MLFDWAFFAQHLFVPSATFLHGLMLTVISVVSQILGTGIGLLAALGRISRLQAVSTLAGLYVWLMRGTPLLVQIVFIYTGFAAANLFRFTDITLGPMVIPANVQAGILALSLNEGAYMAEIIRAGIAGGRYRSSRGGACSGDAADAADAPGRVAPGASAHHSADRQPVQRHAQEQHVGQHHRRA